MSEGTWEARRTRPRASRSTRPRAQGGRWRAAKAAIVVSLIAAAFALLYAPQALAEFPYVGDGTLSDPSSWKLAPGHTPTNGAGDWKLAGTPADPSKPKFTGETKTTIEQNNSQQDELCGVTGMSLVDQHATMPAFGSCIATATTVRTGFGVTVGRPDVAIAELDSGIEWNNSGAMSSERRKVLLNAGELPVPKADLGTAFDPSTGVNCSTAHNGTGADFNPNGGLPGGTPGGSGPIPYDATNQNTFNTFDYACDSRVANVVQNYAQCKNPPTTKECRNGPPGMLTPEDLIIAFSDGIDHDKNGFVNDIAGWNFVDNTNDPYDDVRYGHGTGEVRDSTAEANNGSSGVGTCPNCTVLPLRVGESFVANGERFGQATIYATDRGVDVVQEALGTISDPVLARNAIDYAYKHGVAVIASAADEAAEHHNQPSALPHTIVVNAVEGPADIEGIPVSNQPPSYLQIDGCTNFGTRIDLSIPATSCSSEATGKSAGVAGLIYGAALNACGASLYGGCATGSKLAASSDCTRVDGSPCVITADEVRQLMASGNIAGTTVNGSSTLGSNPASSGTAPADAGEGGQADDVNTAQAPEAACSVGMAANCTDPNLNSTFAGDEKGGVVAPLPDTVRYPTRKGFDEMNGYGRIDAYKAVEAAAQGWVPPQADITSPEWFDQLDPSQSSLAVDGYVNARTNYTCSVEVAPGAQPNNAPASSSAKGDFAAVPSTYCNGSVRSGPHSGLLATINTATLRAMFPNGVPVSFTGNENGGTAQTSNGRPNTLPYAFTIRVIVASAAGAPGPAMTGEDRRQAFLHRDQDMLKGFPIEMRGDGNASPVLVDLAGNDTNQLIVANSDGIIHAYQYDPASGKLADLPGWPVHTDPLPLHTGEHAFASGEVSAAHYGAVIEAPAAGDLFGDGRTEIVADDLQGNVYAWDSSGKLVFHKTSNPSFSGAPLAGDPSWEAQRAGARERTEGGFVTSPVLAKLDSGAGNGLDVIAAGEDRHVYAWHPDGTAVNGFPVLVEDPNKMASVDPASNEVLFNSNAPPNPGRDETQGKIVDTPAVAYLDGPQNPPSIIVGTNEEYVAGRGNEGEINAAKVNTGSLGLLGKVLKFGNSRVYSIKPSGCSSNSSSCATGGFTCAGSTCTATHIRSGWPAKVGLIDAGLLPDVGEGINGSPVVAPLKCPEGGEGPKIGVTPDAGPGYVLNADGSSCYGSEEGKYKALSTDISAGNGKTDTPAFPAVGEPAFGTLDGTTTAMFAPVAGLIRALDVIAPDYQKGGQDFTASWQANSGQYSPGFPAVNNDLSFITGQAVGDVTGEAPKQEVLAGTASQDLQAYNVEGGAASTAWPKLTGDWLVATPTLGSLGTLDTSAGAKKDVVSITRAGTLSVYTTPASACSPSSWPNFHHDIANSGDYTRDAIKPGVPLGATVASKVLHWTAPGDDLMCGTAASYEIATSDSPITPQSFASATPLGGAPAPAAAGAAQSYALPSSARQYVAIRARDRAGNISLPASAEFNAAPALPTLGRCVRIRSKTGDFMGRNCIAQAFGHGRNNWSPGPGARKRFSGQLRAATLETVGGAKITCKSGSSQGEYTGDKTQTVTLTLVGCERPSSHRTCQTSGSPAGQIVTSALEGELGFIKGGGAPTVGVDLRHETSLVTFECTGSGAGAKEVVLLEGSVIAPLRRSRELNRARVGFTFVFKAVGGRQLPDHFEGGAKSTLTLSVLGGLGGGEQTGLSTIETVTNEERLEIKAAI